MNRAKMVELRASSAPPTPILHPSRGTSANQMAIVKHIDFTVHDVTYEMATPSLVPLGNLKGAPVIYGEDEMMWEEAAAYLASRLRLVWSRELDIRTVESDAKHLRAYLEYCESHSLCAMEFGARRQDKPTYGFRGFVIDQKRRRVIAPSTASARMNAVKQFFAWALKCGILPASAQPYIETSMHTQIQDRAGFSRRIAILTSDLSIKKSSRERASLEGGLTPVSRTLRDELIAAGYRHASPEFALMLDLGFRSGMRIETICGLTVESLSKAQANATGETYYIKVGPSHGVPTKQGVNYSPQIPKDLFARLRQYEGSARRLKRTAGADAKNRHLLFLNRWSRPYVDLDRHGANSISQLLQRLKPHLPHTDLRYFYFHCTRATFGTAVVLAGLAAGERKDRIVRRLMELLGHRNASSSFRYIAFVEELKTSEAIDRELEAWSTTS